MAYNDESRRAYVEGASAALECAVLTMDASEAQAIEYWIKVELAEWSSGDPPPPPHEWE